MSTNDTRNAPNRPHSTIALSKDGHRLLAACEDWTVRLFDADTGRQLHRYIGHDKAVNCVAFSPDEKTFASGSFRSLVLVVPGELGTPRRISLTASREMLIEGRYSG